MKQGEINYKDIIMRNINELSDEFCNPISIELTKKFFTQRYENELKRYNNDIKKISDFFIAKKNLELFNIFIEETLPLLEKYLIDIDFKIIKKELRSTHHQLCYTIKYHGVFDFL